MKTLLASSLLAWAAACARVEADIPPICRTASLEFAAAPVVAPAGGKQGQFEQTFTFGAGLKLSFLSQLQFAGGSVAPGNGTADLSFIDSLGLSLAAPAGSPLAEVQLVAWQKTPSRAVASIDVPPQQANIAPYFGASGLSLHVSMTGSPPPAGFSLIVDLCASAILDQTVHL